MMQGELGIPVEASIEAPVPGKNSDGPDAWVEKISRELYAAGFAILHVKWDAMTDDRHSAAAEFRERMGRIGALAAEAAESVDRMLAPREVGP